MNVRGEPGLVLPRGIAGCLRPLGQSDRRGFPGAATIEGTAHVLTVARRVADPVHPEVGEKGMALPIEGCARIERSAVALIRRTIGHRPGLAAVRGPRHMGIDTHARVVV